MRILLVKTSSLGDVIHNLPVASDIANAFPGAGIDWCVEDAFAAIPALHPAIGRVIPVAVRRWRRKLLSARTLSEIAAFRRLLQADAYDAIVDTQGLFKSAMLTRLARGRRLGYAADSAREPLAARFYERHFSVARESHAVLRNRQLAAQALGYHVDPERVDYGLRVAPLHADWLPAGPYAVCLSATSRDDKLWPEAHWQALIAALAARGVAAVLPSGSTVERERTQRIAATSPGSAIVAPPLGLADLAALLRGARLTVGVDTGLSHLSAAVGTPTVALYTATDPGLTGVVAQASAGAPALCVNLGGRGRLPAPGEVLDRLAPVLP